MMTRESENSLHRAAGTLVGLSTNQDLSDSILEQLSLVVKLIDSVLRHELLIIKIPDTKELNK